MKIEIAEARSEVMAPLSAASMESYTRAYPYLVKLHMLQASSSLLRMGDNLEQILLLAPLPFHTYVSKCDLPNRETDSLASSVQPTWVDGGTRGCEALTN